MYVCVCVCVCVCVRGLAALSAQPGSRAFALLPFCTAAPGAVLHTGGACDRRKENKGGGNRRRAGDATAAAARQRTTKKRKRVARPSGCAIRVREKSIISAPPSDKRGASAVAERCTVRGESRQGPPWKAAADTRRRKGRRLKEADVLKKKKKSDPREVAIVQLGPSLLFPPCEGRRRLRSPAGRFTYSGHCCVVVRGASVERKSEEQRRRVQRESPSN